MSLYNQSRSYLQEAGSATDTSSCVVDNAQEDVEGLDEGALGIAAPAVLVPLADTVSLVVVNALGETCFGHVLASGQEGTKVVEEGFGATLFIHALEGLVEVCESIGEAAK